jgi:hypothetical protein
MMLSGNLGTFLEQFELSIYCAPISRADDAWYIQHNGAGKGYMTLASPWFFIHHTGGVSKYFTLYAAAFLTFSVAISESIPQRRQLHVQRALATAHSEP